MIRFKRVVVVSLAVFALTGIAVANADAPTITGFPNQIRRVDLAGYKFITSYPLGANAGFTFEQTYLAAGKVSAAPAAADRPGVHFELRRDAGRKQNADGHVVSG